MKTCSKCGESKPIGEFNKGQYQCKVCANSYARKYRQENREKITAKNRKYRQENREKLRTYHRKRHEENPEKTRVRVRKYREKNREKCRAYNRKHCQKNPEKARARVREYAEKNPKKRGAHQMVSGAIACGILTRKPCEVCGAEPVIAHHDDYSKPLDVRWLCESHHQRHHAAERRRENVNTPEQQARETTSTALATANEHMTLLEDFELESTEDSDIAADMLQDVKVRHKVLETQRKTITKPLMAAKKAVDDLFREPRDMLEQAEKIIKTKIAGYLEAVATKNAEAFAAAGSADTAEEASEALATVAATDAPAGVSVRYTYRATVFNDVIVPDRFRVVDVAMIQAFTNAAVKETGEPSPIPGVAFEKVPVVTSRKASR